MSPVQQLRQMIANSMPELHGVLGPWMFMRTDKKGDFLWTLGVDDDDTKTPTSLDAPRLKVSLKDDGKMIYSYYPIGHLTRSRVGTSTGLYPIKIQLSGNAEEDLAVFLEAMDNVLEIIEPSEEKEKTSREKQDVQVERPISTSWRSSDDEKVIASLFPFRPSHDDIIDLYSKAKELRSNLLMNLVKSRSSNAESAFARRLVILLS